MFIVHYQYRNIDDALFMLSTCLTVFHNSFEFAVSVDKIVSSFSK